MSDKVDILNMLCDYVTSGRAVDRALIAAVTEDLRLWKECVAYSHEQRVEAAIEGSEWKQRALLAEGKLENVPEGWNDLVRERDDARAAARFVWACGKHRMWINYREEAMKKWPWMDSDEDPS